MLAALLLMATVGLMVLIVWDVSQPGTSAVPSDWQVLIQSIQR